MSEITKLYESAGVLKECLSPCYINKTWRKTHDCPNCDNRENYPPFTAEKQIELLGFLTTLDLYAEVRLFEDYDNSYTISVEILDPGFTLAKGNGKTIGEAIAAFINRDWEYLKEEARQKIKGILE